LKCAAASRGGCAAALAGMMANALNMHTCIIARRNIEMSPDPGFGLSVPDAYSDLPLGRSQSLRNNGKSAASRTCSNRGMECGKVQLVGAAEKLCSLVESPASPGWNWIEDGTPQRGMSVA
jgi:hypothetical protein